MDWLQFGVQWLHVLFGILWFGSVLTTNLILIPALNKIPLDRQREFGGVFGAAAEKVLNPVGMIVIALGFLRGTVFGQIQSFDALTTTYGLTWLVGLVAAVATFLWANRMIEPAIHRVNAIPVADALLADGRPSPAMADAIAAAKRASLLELLGFVVIFTCMILMRFGY